jgi:hypothetical protein
MKGSTPHVRREWIGSHCWRVSSTRCSEVVPTGLNLPTLIFYPRRVDPMCSFSYATQMSRRTLQETLP